MNVAVVGAGVAGLACARALVERGSTVTVFDKGRGVGGRLATRRVDDHAFDLGAQYFTLRDDRFALASRGAAAIWHGRIAALDAAGAVSPAEPTERWVGTPSMSALGKHLAQGLDIRESHRVDRINRVADRFAVRGTIEAGATLSPTKGDASVDLGTFDRVVVTVPAPQAVQLLGEVSPRLAEQAAAVEFEACYAVGIVAEALRVLPFDGVFVGRGEASPSKILSWIARDSSKPGRARSERWVLHATGAWSATEQDATAAMVAELARLFALSPIQPTVSVMRRWALAKAVQPLEVGALLDDGIALGGDWAHGGRIEGAFQSGVALADLL